MEFLFTLYGIPLLKGFCLAIFLLAAILFLSSRFNFRKQENHHTPYLALRFGGIALILSFLFVLQQSSDLVFPPSWWVFSGVLLLALIAGSLDDMRNIHWKYQLGTQIILLGLLYVGGVKILSLTNPSGGVFTLANDSFLSIGFLIFVAWGLLILNAVNWLDGIDGLCGSVTAVTYLALFFLALSPVVSQPALAILLAIALGVTLAFLVYNLPPARIIAGTAGSLFFGLSIVFASTVAGTKIATTLLVLALPITDTFFVLAKRVLQKRSIFAPDQGHLHHVLRSQGWSDRAIILSYVLLTAAIGIIALHTQSMGKLVSIASVFGILSLLFAFFHFGKRRTHAAAALVGMISTVFFLIFIAYSLSYAPIRNAWIQGSWYQLEVADTEAKRTQGFSNREQPCARCGMIFLFPEPRTLSFWMKDMRFSLDILWILNGRVVSKNENLPYPSLETFSPQVPVDSVIELPSGAAKNIPIGAKVYFW